MDAVGANEGPTEVPFVVGVSVGVDEAGGDFAVVAHQL